MDDIVYRDGYPCKPFQDGWNVRRWASEDKPPPKGFECVAGLTGPVGGRVGSGQREYRIWPRMAYLQLSDERHLFDATHPETGEDWGVDVDLDELAKKAERCRSKSAARAKRTCRWKIKHGGFNQMLTLTYRENMTDFNRMRKDFAAWLRKMRKAIPGFRAVYGFEPQERGAWHAHVTVDRLPQSMLLKGIKVQSYKAATEVWRSVTGHLVIVGPMRPDEKRDVPNGTVNVDGHLKRTFGIPGKYRPQQSLSKMAGYVSKYLTKEHGNGLSGRQMWGSTESLTPPLAVTFTLPNMPIDEAIRLAYERVPGHRICAHRIGHLGDTWMLYTEPESG